MDSFTYTVSGMHSVQNVIKVLTEEGDDKDARTLFLALGCIALYHMNKPIWMTWCKDRKQFSLGCGERGQVFSRNHPCALDDRRWVKSIILLQANILRLGLFSEYEAAQQITRD